MFLMCHFSSIFSKFSNESSLIIYLEIFKEVNELNKFHFTILIYNSIGKNNTRIIDFGIRTDFHLLFVGQWVRNNTCH